MIVFVTPIDNDRLRIMARASGPGVTGDASEIMRRGQTLLGWSFDDLLARAPGAVDLSKSPSDRASTE